MWLILARRVKDLGIKPDKNLDIFNWLFEE
jgi:hypothetical protein